MKQKSIRYAIACVICLALLVVFSHTIDLVEVGTFIHAMNILGLILFIRYGDKYHCPIYSSELVFEDYKKTKQHFVNKACKWLNDNIDLVAMVTIRAKDNHHQIVMMKNFEQEFKKAMEE